MADKKSLQMTERQGWNVGAQNHGLIQHQEALNSQLRAEFLPSMVPEWASPQKTPASAALLCFHSDRATTTVVCLTRQMDVA